MTELELRVAATKATFDRFNGQPFVLGSMDCARMAAFHLKQMGFKPSLLKGGAYSTPVGARRALKKLGVSSLAEIMDQHFPRWDARAEARTGDICCVPGLGGMGDAMQIVLHRNHVFGPHEGVFAELVAIEPGIAWRVV